MNLQKRIAAQTLKCGTGRIRLDPNKLKEINEAITTFDIKKLIKNGAIKKLQSKGVSRARAKERASQKRKGRRTGHGSRKGKHSARQHPKKTWMQNVRAQRKLLKTLKMKNIITKPTFRQLYTKTKGGFFRSIKHIKLYIQEQNLTRK